MQFNCIEQKNLESYFCFPGFRLNSPVIVDVGLFDQFVDFLVTELLVAPPHDAPELIHGHRPVPVQVKT